MRKTLKYTRGHLKASLTLCSDIQRFIDDTIFTLMAEAFKAGLCENIYGSLFMQKSFAGNQNIDAFSTRWKSDHKSRPRSTRTENK